MADGHGLRDTAELPATYRAYRTVNVKKERKFAIAIQGVFVLVALIAVGAALLLDVPLESSWSPLLSIPVTLLACVLYMAAHEATHGVVLHILTTIKPSYSVRFPFLTTGNNAYLTRRSVVVVALAPAVIWSIVLVAALLLVPQDYRFTTYVLLALNFAGSSGDFVEVCLVSRQRPDALVQDDGDKLHIFVSNESRQP